MGSGIGRAFGALIERPFDDEASVIPRRPSVFILVFRRALDPLCPAAFADGLRASERFHQGTGRRTPWASVRTGDWRRERDPLERGW
jgi:hypothetical protein